MSERLRSLAKAYDQIRVGIDEVISQWHHLLVHGDYTPERLQAQAEALRTLGELANAGAEIAAAIATGLPLAALRAELKEARAQKRRAYWMMSVLSDKKDLVAFESRAERDRLWREMRDVYLAWRDLTDELEQQLPPSDPLRSHRKRPGIDAPS